MFSPHTKHIIAWVFLSAFLMIKVSGLHELTHHNKADVEHCILCQISARDNISPVLNVDNSVAIIVFSNAINVDIDNHYESIFSEKLETSELFNRPPPFYTVS